MKKEGEIHHCSDRDLEELDCYRPNFAFGCLWFTVFLGSILIQSPWAAFHGTVFLLIGILIGVYPPIKSQPKLWWVLAFLFILGAFSSFLPADWFEPKKWRQDLESLEIETGRLVVIQWRYALESLGVFIVFLFTGLWMAGHRASPGGLRLWTLLFTWGVAIYAIASWLIFNFSDTKTITFGFFPNRNHTATYLAMGVVCGLGCVLQAIRDRRFIRMGSALVATCICLWAAGAWSISRAGILLIAVGTLVWLLMLGKRYLGRHGIWAVCLLALAAVGMFLIFNSTVKQRISDTFERTGSLIGNSPDKAQEDVVSVVDLDFRIPTVLDTLGLINDNPWTGIGAGQYQYIFPQYRNLTAVASYADNLHPESDWLWMASEAGVPATVALGLLVLLVLWKSLRAILHGKDRALRGACLVGAALVPFHGIFDVPGHRLTLAFSAILLYSLSLGSLSSRSVISIPRKLPYRIAGLAVLVFAFSLLSFQWFGNPRFATVAAANAMDEAKLLYQKDKVLQQNAAAAEKEYQPDPSEDLLEKALVVLDDASRQVPLNKQILRYKVFIAFHFDDKQNLIDRCFAQERALDPTWVESPYEQGIAWAAIDPTRVAPLWEEALKRADRVGTLDPDNQWARQKTLERMENFSRKNPSIGSVVEELRR